ncbi:MAG: NAD-dependent epimerase/dehydratase family protein [Bacteroidetes bacterium]|nr:NAD-dependent epimerase/dehydratase family protein [Bacteroidota bacterium]
MILVTGGTGLLGSHLLFDLVSRGKQVRAIKRETSNTGMVRKVFSYYSDRADDLFGKIEWVDADIMDFVAIDDALEGIDIVYHAGAVVSFYPKDHKAMLKVNIEGTANLVNLCIARKIKKFCYVSSVAVLGRAVNDGVSDETTFWQPSKKNSVYSQSKNGAEREIWRGIEEGLNAFIINPSVILGPGFWGGGNSGLFSLVWKGLKYYTRGINGFVDVRDVSRAMILLMESDISRERFIVSSENCSYQQVFEYMAKYLGKPAPSVNVPNALTGIAWRVEKVISFIMRRLPEVTQEMATTTTMIYAYSNEKIRKTLGFEFIPVEQSIKETCELFLRDHEEVKCHLPSAI